MDNCKDWTQLKVTVALENLDTLVAIMSMLNNNLMIEDFSDIDLKTCYGDLIDESILNADKTVASVSLFLDADRPFTDAVAFIRDRMSESGFEGKVEIIGVNEEDWANSWKAYYKTLHIGKRMVIVPMWEEYTPAEGEILVTGHTHVTLDVMENGYRHLNPGSISLPKESTAHGYIVIDGGKVEFKTL